MTVQLPPGLPIVGDILARRRRDQERLLTEQQSAVATARLAAMFEAPIPMRTLPALPAPIVAETTDQALPVRRERFAPRKAKSSVPMKVCPDCVETIVETARSCPYCLYDFDRAESAWPASRVDAA